jgi:hypothetical protein
LHAVSRHILEEKERSVGGQLKVQAAHPDNHVIGLFNKLGHDIDIPMRLSMNDDWAPEFGHVARLRNWFRKIINATLLNDVKDSERMASRPAWTQSRDAQQETV